MCPPWQRNCGLPSCYWPSLFTDRNFVGTAKAAPAVPLAFDYYLFTLSWAPEFCATNPPGNSAECDPKKEMGLVVHGLWPQYDNGKWPQDCASTPPVSAATWII